MLFPSLRSCNQGLRPDTKTDEGRKEQKRRQSLRLAEELCLTWGLTNLF